MLRLHRLPTGENGKEEERKSGVPAVSWGPRARKYIRLGSRSAKQASRGLARGCRSVLLSTSSSSASKDSRWKAVMKPPRLICASGTQRK